MSQYLLIPPKYPENGYNLLLSNILQADAVHHSQFNAPGPKNAKQGR
jgi:hypothetical protein